VRLGVGVGVETVLPSGRQSPSNSIMGSKMGILNEKTLSTIFKILNKIKGNSVDDFDCFEVHDFP
jgi:hypothetical protein